MEAEIYSRDKGERERERGMRAWVSRLKESGEGRGGGGGGVAVSKGLELEQSRVQLSLWQGQALRALL